MTIKVSIECEEDSSREIQLYKDDNGVVMIRVLDLDQDGRCMNAFIKLDNLISMINKL